MRMPLFRILWDCLLILKNEAFQDKKFIMLQRGAVKQVVHQLFHSALFGMQRKRQARLCRVRKDFSHFAVWNYIPFYISKAAFPPVF